jgi:hypothetical protein
MTTQEYCVRLLDEVDAAGHDPELAYLVRTRLRRALVALQRGRSDGGGGVTATAPPQIRRLMDDLGARVLTLCQPSEALDVRWKREWRDVLSGVAQLREWVSSDGGSAAA